MRANGVGATLALVCCAVVSGCAATHTALVSDPSCPPATGAIAGEWLVGEWKSDSTYYTLVVSRDGQNIRWTIERPRHPSDRWGTKTAMNGSGIVKTVSQCGAELTGSYDWSESQFQVGKSLGFSGRIDPDGRFTGELLGAGRESIPMRFTRRPADGAAPARSGR